MAENNSDATTGGYSRRDRFIAWARREASDLMNDPARTNPLITKKMYTATYPCAMRNNGENEAPYSQAK
ncbi:hypothetical protein BSFP_002920 [Burkholderia stabilis]|uniref:Uncharacterized protein n=1 Tax=Burkholderia stabilis TaxID=95485 RepID=A0A1Y1BGS4_9BURK|nr:hypothetical protein BSFP_002920 [Burkholderia stabilis]